MAAEIVGIEKIKKYMSKFDFQKIKLSKGSEVVYIHRCKEGESQEDLVNDFTEWYDDFIEPSNFRDYKLELFGSYNPEPNAKLSPVVKVVVAFNHKDAATTTGAFYSKPQNQSSSIDVDKYVAVATENATLKAQLERMEEKMDELLQEEDEDEDEVGAAAPQTFTEAMNNALIGKLDTIVDVVLGMLANRNKPVNHYQGINGVESSIMDEFKQIHPEIEEDLARLLQLAKTQPDFFKMLIGQLRKMV